MWQEEVDEDEEKKFGSVAFFFVSPGPEVSGPFPGVLRSVPAKGFGLSSAWRGKKGGFEDEARLER